MKNKNYFGFSAIYIIISIICFQPWASFGQNQSVTDDTPFLLIPAAITSSNPDISQIHTVNEGKSVILWNNGPFVTGYGTGNAPDTSILQNSSLGLTSNGFGNSTSVGNRVSDDFTIPGGVNWTIDSIIFFSFQTNSDTFSTMTAFNLRVWDGIPDSTGEIVWGDSITNRLNNSKWSGCYRAAETTPGNKSRPIMRNKINTPSLTLAPGNYYIDWQSSGSLSSGPWVPPITILGASITGNSWQMVSGNWIKAVDGGLSTWQGLPFIIYGTSNPIGGIDAIESENIFHIFPNPASDVIYYNYTSSIEAIMITDICGRVIMNLEHPEKNGSINLYEFSPGMYLLILENGTQPITQTIIIQ